MTGRLEGKRAIITGAASGIGRGCVDVFLSEGATVAAVDRNANVLKEWEASQTRGRTWALDVSKSAEVNSILGSAIEWMGGVDVLVNAAGITTSSDVLELSEEDFDRVMDVNVKGSFLCAQVSARSMRDARGGAIVNISSIAAELANPDNVHYSTSKGAVRTMTKALAVALAPHNIRVNAVAPGPTNTGMGKTEIYDRDPETMNRILGRVLRGRIGQPSDIAAAVAFLASDEADFINGTTLYVDGGVTAVR